MLIKVIVSLAFVGLMGPMTASGQTTGSSAAQSASKGPFSTARPYLVSISVSNLDDAVKWYGDNLGFVVVKKKDLPRYSPRIAFVELNQFQLELIEFKQSVSYESIRKQFPSVDDRSKIQGMEKLAFLVDDVQAAAATLKSKGVRFERNVTDDPEFGSNGSLSPTITETGFSSSRN